MAKAMTQAAREKYYDSFLVVDTSKTSKLGNQLVNALVQHKKTFKSGKPSDSQLEFHNRLMTASWDMVNITNAKKMPSDAKKRFRAANSVLHEFKVRKASPASVVRRPLPKYCKISGPRDTCKCGSSAKTAKKEHRMLCTLHIARYGRA